MGAELIKMCIRRQERIEDCRALSKIGNRLNFVVFNFAGICDISITLILYAFDFLQHTCVLLDYLNFV